MASRRRRRKSIGKVIVDVESRLRKNEKRLAPKKIKRNSVSYAKIGYRSVSTSSLQTNSVTPNEASFGTPIVSETEPTENLKDGTLWVNPTDGSASAYDKTNETFVDLAAVDLVARASADGKNTIYRQADEPTGGTYVAGDTWFDTDDDNKIYRYDGTSWVGFTLGNNALASISANKITAGTIDASVITVSNLDAGNITTGSMSASRISSGTISASVTMTSPTIKTAASGTRIEISSASSNVIKFFGSGTAEGAISINDYRIFVYAPGSTYGAGAVLSLYGDEALTTPNGIFMTGGTSKLLNFSMSSTTISLDQGTYKLRVSANGVVVDGAAGLTGYYVRNTQITTSTPTSGAVSGTTDGNIVLVREA